MNTRNTQGFTLVELLVTLAVAAIVLAWGVPSFIDFVKNNRLVGYANEFVAATHLARSEAIKHRRYGYICPSSSYASTTPTCDATTDWSNGWVVWVDDDADNAIDASEVLRVMEPFHASVTFGSAGAQQYRYDPMGVVNTADTLDLCDDRTGETGRRISISNAGRANITNLTCS